jgi:hypothetical protein
VTPVSPGAPAALLWPRIRRLASLPWVRETVPLAGTILLAAVLRLPGLDARGTWDADQGAEMLVLRALARDGVLPLLGPITSIGGFHHGALYYYVLAPAALVTSGDSPFAVSLVIALGGIAAVPAVWWLARSIGGPLAGVIAAGLLAVSAVAVEQATFIWNPNLILLSSTIALASAWRAWTQASARWWLAAAAGVALTVQLHVLSAVLAPIVFGLFVADARRRHATHRLRALFLSAMGAVLVMALAYLPLIVHEIQSDFEETRAALAYLGAAGVGSSLDPLTRTVIVTVRLITWPLVGLFTEAPVPALLATVGVACLVLWAVLQRRSETNRGVVWLGAGLLWSVVALTFGSATSAVVVPGLPNDQYHAFVDPIVLTLVGTAGATAWSRMPLRPPLALVLFALFSWNLARQPPAIADDGGFPAAVVAAERMREASEGRPTQLLSLPDFKPTDAYGYPLVRAGHPLVDGTGGAVVVICDGLFEEAIGARCGGPAEDALLAANAANGSLRLVDRFVAARGRTISVYLRDGG